LLQLALIAIALVLVAVSPTSAGMLSDDLLPSSNFERAGRSTAPGAITVSGPEGAKYVVFDLDSYARFPDHTLTLDGHSAHSVQGLHIGWGHGAHLAGGWSSWASDVGTSHSGHAYGSGDGHGDGHGNGGGGGGGGSWLSGGGAGGGADGAGGRRGRNASNDPPALGADYVTTDGGQWVGDGPALLPEPATLSLLAAGLGTLTATARRRGGRKS
jgi:PEP-CTERM motif-containing protein